MDKNAQMGGTSIRMDVNNNEYILTNQMLLTKSSTLFRAALGKEKLMT